MIIFFASLLNLQLNMKLSEAYFHNRDKQPCITFNPECELPEKKKFMLLPQKRLEFPGVVVVVGGGGHFSTKCKEIYDA